MSYELERYAITTYLREQEWFGLSPFGLDGESVTAADGAGYMTILSGSAGRISVGSPGANLHQYVGVLQISFWKDGGLGSRASRITADTIINAFTGLKLDETGYAVGAAPSVVIDFERAGVPYLAAATPEAPFMRTVVNAPFSRIERK